MSIRIPNLAVDDIVRGEEFNWKARCRLSSTQDTNWTTSATAGFDAASFVLTLASLTTGTTLGLIDSVEPVVEDRILLKDLGAISGAGAGTAANDDGFNGLWKVTGGTTTSVTLVRTYDLLVGDNALNTTIWVDEGTVEANRAYMTTSNVTVTDAATNDVVFFRWDVRDTLEVARGGTGSISFTSGSLLEGNGAGALTASTVVSADVVTQTATSGADNLIPKYVGDSKIIEASGISVDDSDNMTGLGNMGLSGDILDANGNELINLITTGSAVNEISITNAATGTAPIIASSGESNVDLEFNTAGTGSFLFGAGDAATSASIRLEDNTGGEYGAITVPDTVTTSFTLTLPDGVGSSGQALVTDGNNPATLTWSSVGTDRRDFIWQSLTVVANKTSPTEVANFAWDDSAFASFTTNTITFWHEDVDNRDLTVEVFDATNTTSLGTTTISSPASDGIVTFTFSDPVGDSRIALRVSKNTSGGTNPSIYGVQMSFT